MPIMDADYAFTIGMTELNKDCKRELVVAGMGPYQSAQAAGVAGKAVAQGGGEYDVSKWENGTVRRFSGINVPFKIKILDVNIVQKYLGNSLRHDLPEATLAYQLLWPDANGEWTEETLAHQMFDQPNTKKKNKKSQYQSSAKK
jgi:hypothetical protein